MQIYGIKIDGFFICAGAIVTGLTVAGLAILAAMIHTIIH